MITYRFIEKVKCTNLFMDTLLHKLEAFMNLGFLTKTIIKVNIQLHLTFSLFPFHTKYNFLILEVVTSVVNFCTSSSSSIIGPIQCPKKALNFTLMTGFKP